MSSRPDELAIAWIVLSSLLASAPTLLAQPQWHYEVNKHGLRSAFIEQRATVLGADCMTHLRFNAAQDRKEGAVGMLGLYFMVSPMRSIKGFDFEYFHGRDAPVGDRELMRVTVTKEGESFVHRLGAGGFLSAEVRDGFVFHASNPTHDKQGRVRKLLDQLRGAERLEIAVIDGRDPAIVLSITFPLAGSKPALEALLKGF